MEVIHHQGQGIHSSYLILGCASNAFSKSFTHLTSTPYGFISGKNSVCKTDYFKIITIGFKIREAVRITAESTLPRMLITVRLLQFLAHTIQTFEVFY